MTRALSDLLAQNRARRAAENERYRNLDMDQCQLCHTRSPDTRSLTVACGYAVHEVVPEAIDMLEVDGSADYYLRTCKSCRGRFLRMMGNWRAACVALRGRGGRDD